MTAITHLTAQSLLQLGADSALAPVDETNLHNHLAECEECRQYAQFLDRLQSGLRRATHQRWDQVSMQLSASEIKQGVVKTRAQTYNFQTLGKFSIALLALVIVLVLSMNFPSTLTSLPATVGGLSPSPKNPVLTPTPTVQTTLASAVSPKCNDIAYIVQEGDTLESIAAKHSASIESIKERNGLAASALAPNMVLTILICDGTPTNSTVTPTTTTTATPGK